MKEFWRDYIARVKTCWPRGVVTLGLAALAVGLTGIFKWVARQQDVDAHMPQFIGLLLLAGIFYVIGVFWVERFRLGATALLIILVGGVLFRVVLLPAPSTLSDDVYRYQWDGRAQRAHLNPYVVFPNAEGLEWLENPEHPEPPGEETPTIYPPISEFAYRLIETVPGYKRVCTILDLASGGLLMLLLAAMNQPLHRVLAYAWNPAVLISFAMSGHFDALAIVTFLMALFLLVTNRPALSMAALALSFLSKFYPVLLLPTFLKRVRLAHVGIFVALVFTCYVPFLDAGRHLFDGAGNYARDWVNNATIFSLLQFAVGSRAGAELVAALIMLATIGYLAKNRATPLWSSFVLTGGVLLVSPTAYPWYFTWSIPFLCFYPSAAWLLMTVTSILAYAPAITYGAGEPLKNSLLMLSLEYGPVYLWLVYDCWSARRPKLSTVPQAVVKYTRIPMKANIDLDVGRKTFASGLLPELIAALRRSRPGDLIAVVGAEKSIGTELETWCRFTGNALVESSVENDQGRWVIRHGTVPSESNRPVGSRLWLYTNFDCNLRCDYCCVRSSPGAPRRELGLARVKRIAREAAELRVQEIFVTGGEPFLLPDVGEILLACAAAAPTTVLTNGMLFAGRRMESLRTLPRDRIVLQISLDSATPERHDLHRGAGTWSRTRQGIGLARAQGFRVRLAATVSSDREAEEFRQFLDEEQIALEDRVIRRIALRGSATEGVALARSDLVPEVTITAEGVYWHPVGAEDADLLVTHDIFPLAEAFAAVRRAFEREGEHALKLAKIFNCA